MVIEMPATSFKPGDTFFTNVQFCYMEDGPFEELPVFMILDVYGALFFAPSFSETLDYYMIDTAMTTELLIEVLPPFAWPAGAGEAQGITWIAAITDPGISMLIGEMDLATFSWEE